jgi:multidrug efflux system membrane fusion protein
MRLRAQYLFIIAVVGVVALWMVFRAATGGGEASQAQAKPLPPDRAAPSVQVKVVPETPHQMDVGLRGRTEAIRTVSVKSETAGLVAATPAREGGFVRKGEVLCRLSVDARQASLDQARAMLKSRQLSKDAASKLSQQGYRSPTQVLQAQADLDTAQAQVRAAEIALEQVNIRAPFAGVFDHRDAEIGTYLSPGQPCGTMIELDPILVVGDVPETDAAQLRIGAPATAKLVSGQVLNGRVRYVAHDADPQTRTYHVEVSVPNGKLAVRSGLSADLSVSVGVGPAHFVPLSSLVLDSQGRQGVRYVAAGDQVAFAPVKVLEETPKGIWVSGLSGPVRLIVVGQSFVGDGQKVRVAMAP